LQAFANISRSVQATHALTHASYNNRVSLATIRDTFQGFFSALQHADAPKDASWPQLTWVVTDIIKADAAGSSSSGHPVLDNHTADNLSFLQFTSGSTSVPKGVMITHGNLAHNLCAIVSALHATSDTVVVSWLPQVSHPHSS
jgi:long-subunit acyl-CoA synthetase (AMP-forming)